jgi:transposase
VTEESLMQYGYNSNDKNQPQVSVMAASADIGTNGHLVATEVVSGQKADAPLRSRFWSEGARPKGTGSAVQG